MFDTAYYLHYVLDSENDSHYTEDLMRLSAGSYLWHELKECHGFSRVVFVNLVNNRLMLETFDNASYQLLQPVKKGLFGKVKEQPAEQGLCHKTFHPAEIKQEDSTLLHFLLECQQNHKKERTALVCTAESLEALCDRSVREGRSRLTSYIENHPLPAVLVVRLGMNTTALRKTFLDTHCFLGELDRNIREVLRSHALQPLLGMLWQQLRGQLTDFTRQEGDMLNLLMYDALERGAGQDTPDQLRDQADYLRLCLYTGVGLADAFANFPRHEPLKRDTVYGKLADPAFRNRLRSDAARLRARNPESPMEDLFRREFQVSWDNSGIQELCCEDELYRKVCGLKLPEEYLIRNLTQERVPQALRKTLATLWNKPRNPKVCEMIRFCTDMALEAVTRSDWVTLTDTLNMLSLCNRQLCADPALNDNLDEIFATARELITASADQSQKKKSYADMCAATGSHASTSQMDAAAHLFSKVDMDSQDMKLNMLRVSLNDAILYFNDHPLSDQVEKTLRASMARWKEKLDRSQADSELYGTLSTGKPGDSWHP